MPLNILVKNKNSKKLTLTNYKFNSCLYIKYLGSFISILIFTIVENKLLSESMFSFLLKGTTAIIWRRTFLKRQYMLTWLQFSYF